MSPWVTRLIAANVAVFVLTLVSPSVGQMLALVPSDILHRPWTLVTYMFVHANVMHLLFNMLGLFFFGPALEMRLGSRDFLLVYFLSGIGGGLLSFLLSPNAAVVGASGATMGVLAGFARLWPDERIYIWGILPVTARTMVILFALYSIYAGFSGGGNVAHFAHLGGIAVGFGYVLFAQRRKRGVWPQKERSVIRAVVENRGRRDRWESMRLDHLHEINRIEAERILSKLRSTGEGSLTQKEREFMDRMSIG